MTRTRFVVVEWLDRRPGLLRFTVVREPQNDVEFAQTHTRPLYRTTSKREAEKVAAALNADPTKLSTMVAVEPVGFRSPYCC